MRAGEIGMDAFCMHFVRLSYFCGTFLAGKQNVQARNVCTGPSGFFARVAGFQSPTLCNILRKSSQSHLHQCPHYFNCFFTRASPSILPSAIILCHRAATRATFRQNLFVCEDARFRHAAPLLHVSQAPHVLAAQPA